MHLILADGVKDYMRSEIETIEHVPAIRLWQAMCGGAELPTRQYEHVIHCVACETLATQMGDALDDIEEALRRNHLGMGNNPGIARLN